MKHYQKTKYLIVLLFLLLPAISAAQQRIAIAQFGKEKFLLYLPLYVAMEKGYFTANGLEVNLIFAGNDDQVFAAVASGDVQFGVGDPVFTAIAQEKGFAAKTVATLITNLGISGYTNNPQIKFISSPNNLSGLRIGSLPKPSTTFTLLDEIRRNHQPILKDTTIVEAGIGGQLALLESGAVDLAMDLEPAVSKLEAQGYRVVFNLNEHIESQVITGLMTTEENIKSNAKVVQAVVKSLQQALDTMHSEPLVAFEVANNLFPELGQKIVSQAVSRMMKMEVYPKSVLVVDSYWQRTLKTRLDSGQLKTPQATNVSVDNSFALNLQAKPQ